jgi:hypothetical protein
MKPRTGSGSGRPRGTCSCHPDSSNSRAAGGGGGGGGSRRSTTGGAVRRDSTGGEAGEDSVLRSTSPRVGGAGPRRASGRTRAGGRRGAMRAVRARDAAWRRARAAAALRARATRALARAFVKRLLAVGAARAESCGRSGAGDANDGTGGAGAVFATPALSLAPGAGAARSTTSGTIIPIPAAATTAQRLHAFLRIIRSRTPRRLRMRRRRGAAARPSAIRASEQRHRHTVHRTRRLPAKNKGTVPKNGATRCIGKTRRVRRAHVRRSRPDRDQSGPPPRALACQSSSGAVRRVDARHRDHSDVMPQRPWLCSRIRARAASGDAPR